MHGMGTHTFQCSKPSNGNAFKGLEGATFVTGPNFGNTTDMKALISLLALVFISAGGFANKQRNTRSQYIEMWKDEAIYQMVTHHIPASITLAQGILESGDGNSTLAKGSNNHFGIKCHSDWTGAKTYHDDDKKGECFREYPDARQSFEDHSDFLLKKRYSSLFDLKITDYKGWAKGLKKCGYATASTYAKLLIQIVEANDLTQYDKVGVKRIDSGEMPSRGDAGTEDFVDTGADAQEEAQPAAKRNRKGDKLPDVTWSSSKTLSVSENRIQYVLADGGETIVSMANELGLMPWQIRKYNDLGEGHTFGAGERVYLQPKRVWGKTKTHTVSEGETLRDISQKHGVRLKRIRKRNGLAPGTQPVAGTVLHLNRSASAK